MKEKYRSLKEKNKISRGMGSHLHTALKFGFASQRLKVLRLTAETVAKDLDELLGDNAQAFIDHSVEQLLKLGVTGDQMEPTMRRMALAWKAYDCDEGSSDRLEANIQDVRADLERLQVRIDRRRRMRTHLEEKRYELEKMEASYAAVVVDAEEAAAVYREVQDELNALLEQQTRGE